MEPIFGFILYLAACAIPALIAAKKGRSILAFFLMPAASGFLLVLIVASATGGNGFDAAVAAFIAPLVGLVVSIMVGNREQVAAKEGEYGGYRKCPFCAESVRSEAIKCRHCGSDISQSALNLSATTRTGEAAAPSVARTRGQRATLE